MGLLIVATRNSEPLSGSWRSFAEWMVSRTLFKSSHPAYFQISLHLPHSKSEKVALAPLLLEIDLAHALIPCLTQICFGRFIVLFSQHV